jgi:hypothetical protein
MLPHRKRSDDRAREARRLVLDQFARHYHRPFADQWDFVDYAHQQQPILELTTPPTRSRMSP